MTCRLGTAASAVAVALLLAPAAAGAAPRQVKVLASKFDPAVVVVGPGTEVEWRNDDSHGRALRGDFESPDIAPGRTYVRRFTRLGRFDYQDRDNPAITGTVLVTIHGTRRPRYPRPPGGTVTHRWRGSLRLDLRENWKYYDGKFRSFNGVCNAEVGDGSRAVTFLATFPTVKYQRVAGIEVLRGVSRRYGIQRYREQIAALTSNPGGGRLVACPDGSSDPPPDVEQRCDHDYARTPVRGTLSWAPRIASGRLTWTHAYLGARPAFGANCGAGFLAAGNLIGLRPLTLPFWMAGNALLYDDGQTSPLTAAEVRALRAGRAITVTRSFELHFTVDCCVEWNEEGKPGTYDRAGARFDVLAQVTIRLRPR